MAQPSYHPNGGGGGGGGGMAGLLFYVDALQHSWLKMSLAQVIIHGEMYDS